MAVSASNKLPRDVQLQEGLRDVMDKKVKLSLKILVKMEIKGDKTDNRVLAFTPCRIFILNAKPPLKVEHNFHFLDIQSIESKKQNQLCLTVEGKPYTFQTLDAHTDEMDHIITHIGVSLKHIFPAFPLERLIVKVDVQPEDRLHVMNDQIQAIESKGTGPCGGYTTMYQCMCDYHSLPFRDEVEWDVDTIYLSLDSRECRLQDFDHLAGKDMIPIIAALEHNTWFRSINASNVKLSLEACTELIRVMKRNAVLEEINLSNTGIKSEFVQKLALALISNSGSQLNSIDLSNNLLEDRGVTHLLGALIKLPCGVTHLDMSRTGISTKCLNKVGEVFSQSPNILASLTTLKLNDNGLKGEDLPLFYTCLAQQNAITYLDVSSTDCALDTLCDPLLRGCPSLTTLKASGIVFTHKRSKEVQVPLSWKQLFTSACFLEVVDLSSCRLPPEALKELLLGVSANRNLKGVYLDVSSNELGPSGAAMLAPCLSSLAGVRGLDISNNGLDAELKNILTELAKNRHLKQLSIGRNFANIKSKFRTEVISALTQLLQEEGSVLESLSIADSKLKGETAYVINALGSNETLVEIDISGNAIGDIGARMLAKALMINNKLKKIIWDKNIVSAQGFEDVAEALKNNLTVKKMPYPLNDAAAALRMYPERVEVALHKIESCLQRNNSPRRFAPDQAFRLQQGFLISSTQQMVDRLVVKVEDAVKALQSSDTEALLEQDIAGAQKLVADANMSRQLLPSLQDIAFKSQATGNPVEKQLQEMADTLRSAIEEQMKKTTEEMLQCTSTHCPAVMENEAFKDTVVEGCHSKSVLPKEFTTGVLETVSTDIYNTTSEMNLAQAALISDSVIDEVIDSLTCRLKSLTDHLNERKAACKHEEKDSDSDAVARLRVTDESSPKLSNKRKSVLNRKTRPQSTMGLGEESPIHTPPRAPAVPTPVDNHIMGKVKRSPGGSMESSTEQIAVLDFPDLPAALPVSRPLEHVTKTRPERKKMHRPTRPVVHTGSTLIEEGPDNGLGLQVPLQVPSPQASSTAQTAVSPKVNDKKEHKTRKDQSPSASKSKHDDTTGVKSESKKWWKKKEDKSEKEFKKSEKSEKLEKDQKEAKKSNSFSSSFTGFFKKRGSEDKKRLANDTAPSSDSKTDSELEQSATTSGSDVDDSRTGLTVVKEVDSATDCSVDTTVASDKAAAEPMPSIAPVAPRRHLSPAAKQAGSIAAALTASQVVRKSTDVHLSGDAPCEITLDSSVLVTKEDESMPAGEKIKAVVEEESESCEVPATQHKKEVAGDEQDATTKPGSDEGVGQGEETMKEAEVEEKKDNVPKLPPGLAKMPGLSALGGKNLLLEIKSKQEKRLSHKPPASSPEEKKDVDASPKPVSETNNNTHDSTSSLSPTAPSKPDRSSSSPQTSSPVHPLARTSRPPSSESPSTDSLSASTPANKEPVSPSKLRKPALLPPKNPSPAPRSSGLVTPVAAKRPVSVVEGPGSLTADIPSSMTTSTPEFHFEESAGGSVVQRPAPPVKPRPQILPRPRKRDSAPPVEESSDAHTVTSPTTATAKSEPATVKQLETDRKVPEVVTEGQPRDSHAGDQITKSLFRSSSNKSNSVSKSTSLTQDSKENSPKNSSESKDNHHSLSSSRNIKPSVLPKPEDEMQDKTSPEVQPAACEISASPSEDGVVYDSSTLRMSVKDKIKRLSKVPGQAPQTISSLAGASAAKAKSIEAKDQSSSNNNADNALPAAKIKAMSLPKDARLPGSAAPGDDSKVDQDLGEIVKSIEEEENDSSSDDDGPPPPDGEIMV